MTEAVHYSKLFLRTHAFHAACFHGPAFIDKFVICRSATSAGAGSTLFHRHCPHFDLYRVSSSRSSQSSHFRSNRSPRAAVNRTAAVHYSNLFYAIMSAMQPAITDLFSSLSWFFISQRHQLVQSLPSSIVFVVISTSSRWQPLGVHSATIRIAHLLCPILFFLIT